MHIKQTYLFLLALILLSAFTVMQTSKTSNEIELLTTQTEFEAGSEIVLKFS